MQPKQRNWFSGIVVSALPIAGLITMLLALAVLQLRWSAKVSEAERARLQQNLQRSTSGFQSAFARELLGMCQTLQASQPRAQATLVDHLFNRYSVWRRISGNAALIQGLYIWPQSNGKTDTLLRFDLQDGKLEPVAWPESLRPFSTKASLARAGVVSRYSKAWVWSERVPALIHPLYMSGKQGAAQRPQLFGYLFVVFDAHDISQVYLPDLGRRYFPLSNGFVFQLTEPNGVHGRQVVYESDRTRQVVLFTHADVVIPLLDSSKSYAAAARSSLANNGIPTSGPVRLLVSDAAKWKLAVRHRSGSVDAAVVSMRRRDLAVSIIVLAMLLVSLITILIATRRARKLAKLQMEFASGISHELRTPLAVIRSAAENLADGVVTEGERVRDYGALIHKESQHLAGMVDHILDFAQLHSDVHAYRMESAAAADIVKDVLEKERSSMEAAGVVVEVKLPNDLPLLLTDAPVLGQCLQNLVSNAVKYGSSGGKILLDVSVAHEDGEDHVRIRVQDFGSGIEPEELSHIYEPFYRAGSARDSQIRGTGLGLSLTRKMMEGLHGRITVESSPGKGSAFTLHVPAASSDHPSVLASERAHSR